MSHLVSFSFSFLLFYTYLLYLKYLCVFGAFSSFCFVDFCVNKSVLSRDTVPHWWWLAIIYKKTLSLTLIACIQSLVESRWTDSFSWLTSDQAGQLKFRFESNSISVLKPSKCSFPLFFCPGFIIVMLSMLFLLTFWINSRSLLTPSEKVQDQPTSFLYFLVSTGY